MVWDSNEKWEYQIEEEKKMTLSFQMFIMTLGGFGDIWDEIHETQYIVIGEAWQSFSTEKGKNGDL